MGRDEGFLSLSVGYSGAQALIPWSAGKIGLGMEPPVDIWSNGPLGITPPAPLFTTSEIEYEAINGAASPELGPSYNMQEIVCAISGITSSRVRAALSPCISAPETLLSTAEVRNLLSNQEGENTLVWVDLFDRVAISPRSYALSTRAENADFRL